MKHLFGRFYFFKPCFIGIMVYNRRLAVVLNVVLSMVVIGIFYLLVR